jgi:hypothetical protein
MIMIRQILPVSTLFLLFGALSLQGQPEEVPTVNLNWRGLSLENSVRGLGYLDGETVERIFIPNATFSNPYTYSGPLPIRFAGKEESEKPLEEMNILAQVNVPVDTKEAIFFFDSSGPEGSLRIFPVTLEPEPLQLGQVLAINATERNIAGFHDGVRFELPRGRTTTFTPDQSGDTRVIQVSVQLATLEEDGWQARVNSRYGMTPDMRVRLLFRSGDNGSIKVIPLRDRAPTPPSEESAGIEE